MANAFKVNLQAQGKPVTMYNNWDFNSFGEFAGRVWGAKSDGLFNLFDSDTDNGTAINASFELYTDFGSMGTKKVRSVNLSYVAQGALLVECGAEDLKTKPFILNVRRVCKHGANTVIIGKDTQGVYWLFRFSNLTGAKFILDKITATVINTEKVVGKS